MKLKNLEIINNEYAEFSIFSKVYGQVKVKIDMDDIDKLKNNSWYLGKNSHHKTYYVKTEIKNSEIKLHRLLLGISDSNVQIDHINRDGLDNRKGNLRIANAVQNSQNRAIRSDNKTGFKGVYYNKTSSKYRAQIMVDYKKMHLGSFAAAEEAAQAYNEAAIKYFGEFAYLNVIPEKK